MIKQEVKDKLKLYGTGIHSGESFINNCEFMWSGLLQCYVSDCDLQGKKLEEKYMFYNRKKGQWKSAIAAEQFIEDAPFEALTVFVKQHLAIV